jgi:putative addiction module component (TIGR02574 family)
MNATAQEILSTALQLPEKDRADLAASLMDSLDGPADADSQAAWAEETRRRLAELDGGNVKTVSWQEARAIIAGHPK